jgi:hypothetical protein
VALLFPSRGMPPLELSLNSDADCGACDHTTSPKLVQFFNNKQPEKTLEVVFGF